MPQALAIQECVGHPLPFRISQYSWGRALNEGARIMKELSTRCCRSPWEEHTTGSGSWMCVEVTERGNQWRLPGGRNTGLKSEEWSRACGSLTLWTIDSPGEGLPWWSRGWLQAPNTGPGSMPSQEIGVHMLQPSISHASTKTQSSPPHPPPQ